MVRNGKIRDFHIFLMVVFVWLLFGSSASAQLVECDQVSGGGTSVGADAPGGCIARPLADQVDLGHNNNVTGTPGSGNINTGSIFLIKHDPARSVRRGRQLFQRKFTEDEGQGPRVNDGSSGDIRTNRALGAGLADSCAACHGRPRGSAGFGGDVNTFPDSRDSPHLFGLGLVEQLGDEMTTDLRAIRAQAIADATGGGGGPETPVDADFDLGTDGFNYNDDTFNGTNNPAYAFGDRVFAGSDGVLRVKLGNIDSANIFGMSGAWVHTFNVSSGGAGTLELNWRLLQSSEYESDEVSEALVEVDGTVYTLGTFTGNGNGGSNMDTGEQFASISLGNLAAGSHTIKVGGYNNKKTFTDEFTEAFYNNVKITVDGTCPVTRPLDTKGVSFGSITVACNGTVDYSAVEGVNTPSLRVKPFFAQGGTISMREFLIGAFKAEMGLEAFDPILCAVTDPVSPVAMTSPSGFHYDPALDTDFERPPVCDAVTDGDGDGVVNEIDAALVDHTEFYLLNYFKPGRYMETARSQQGLALMNSIGCTSCHVQNLTIDSDRRVADVETGFDPVRGIFNELFAEATTRFTAAPDPANPGFSLVLPEGNSFVVENIFSDLKRHDLGPDFDERDFDGTFVREHVTEPLWGVGSTSPYGHDGRSINLDAVIRRHGGEAASVTLAFANLSEDDQRKVIEFLETLILFPPDDTASDLAGGEGDPTAPNFPQNGHGNINLPALFTIPNSDIGPE